MNAARPMPKHAVKYFEQQLRKTAAAPQPKDRAWFIAQTRRIAKSFHSLPGDFFRAVATVVLLLWVIFDECRVYLVERFDWNGADRVATFGLKWFLGFAALYLVWIVATAVVAGDIALAVSR